MKADVLVRVSIVLKRHRDHGKPCNYSVLLTVERFSPFQSWWEARQHAGKCAAGEGAQSSYTLSHGQQEMVCFTGCGLNISEMSKDTPTVTHFLQQGHTAQLCSPFQGPFSFKPQLICLLRTKHLNKNIQVFVIVKNHIKESELKFSRYATF